MGPICPTPVNPTVNPGSWLTFLCKASDAPGEPHPVAFYKELFANDQRNLLFDYFMEVSGGRVNVSGSDVFGWFPMTVNTDTISPAKRNNGTNPNRSQTVQDCISAGVAGIAARGQSIDIGKYDGVIAVVNVPVDAGAAGQGLTANASEEVAFYEHEMLHVYGLPHSMAMSAAPSNDHVWEGGTDSEYNDCWDIMSWRTCTRQITTSAHGGSGPELQIAYRDALAWMPLGRIFVKDARDVAPSTVTLAPVGEPSASGFLMAKIAFPLIGSYVVEFRVKASFDGAVLAPVVLIRELRKDGRTYLVRRGNDISFFKAGDVFTDLGNYLSISIDSITTHAATITIHTRVSSPTQLGEKCGDKFFGAIRQCPPDSVCKERRTGTITSVDWFCQPAPDVARFVSRTGTPTTTIAPGASFTEVVTFLNSGEVPWVGQHTMAVGDSLSGFPAQSFAVGSVASPVEPQQSTSHAFTLQAPSQPGTYNLGFALRDSINRVLAASPAAQIVVGAPNTPVDNAGLAIASAPSSLRNGESGNVTVTGQNIGTTTWSSQRYSLQLGRNLRISLPASSVPVTGSVAPGGSQSFTFTVMCNGQGQGSFSAQMAETQAGKFGQQVGRTIICQP
jgi:hypothetical protein